MHAWTDGTDYLMHHGIKGQKWGIRRYQNPDGTLTEAGKQRLNKYKETEYAYMNRLYDKRVEKRNKKYDRLDRKSSKLAEKGRDASKIQRKMDAITAQAIDDALNTSMEATAIKTMTYSQMQKEKKTAIAIGAAAIAGNIAGVGLAMYLRTPFYMVSIPDVPGIIRQDRIERFKKESGLDITVKS